MGVPERLIDEMIDAAGRGDTAGAIARIEAGIDVNARGFGEFTALWMAARNGHAATMRALLDRGASPDVARDDGQTLLSFAITRARPDSREPDPLPLAILREAGVRYRLIDAVLANDLALARAHLDAGADPGAGAGSYHGPLLLQASRAGHAEMVALLLDRGADIEATDDLQHGPLLVAARRGRVAVARLLLDRGADIDAVGCAGQGALAVAAAEGHRELVDLLLGRGARRGVVDALALGEVRLFESLLAEELQEWGDPDDDERSPDKPRPPAAVDSMSDGLVRLAMLAARRGDVEMMAILLDRGAELLHKWSDDRSLLAEAARLGHVDLARFLLDRGSDPRATGKDGLTAIAWAARSGQAAIARMLENPDSEAGPP